MPVAPEGANIREVEMLAWVGGQMREWIKPLIFARKVTPCSSGTTLSPERAEPPPNHPVSRRWKCVPSACHQLRHWMRASDRSIVATPRFGLIFVENDWNFKIEHMNAMNHLKINVGKKYRILNDRPQTKILVMDQYFSNIKSRQAFHKSSRWR